MVEMIKPTVIIVSPSLDPMVNVSGVSAVVNFIIANNKHADYIHFKQGKSDEENGCLFNRIKRIVWDYVKWRGFLKEHNATLIHYNLSMEVNSILRDVPFILYAYRHKRRIVAHIHGGKFLFETNYPFIIKMFLKKLFSMNIPFIVLSEKEKEAIGTEFPHSKLYVLPNAIDLADASNFRRVVCGKQLDVLFLGRITPEKGIEYILTACKILKENGIKFMLHVAGKENGESHYIEDFEKALGEKCFKYEGVVYGESKQSLLKQCNIFLLPSFYEGLPMSLLESMSYSEVPVVTNVGSVGKVVNNKENGLLVEVKSAQSIVDAITELYNNKKELERLSENAKNTIFSMFNPQEYIDKLNTIYSNTPPPRWCIIINLTNGDTASCTPRKEVA